MISVHNSFVLKIHHASLLMHEDDIEERKNMTYWTVNWLNGSNYSMQNMIFHNVFFKKMFILLN